MKTSALSLLAALARKKFTPQTMLTIISIRDSLR
jgi:hypothetical protein